MQTDVILLLVTECFLTYINEFLLDASNQKRFETHSRLIYWVDFSAFESSATSNIQGIYYQ